MIAHRVLLITGGQAHPYSLHSDILKTALTSSGMVVTQTNEAAALVGVSKGRQDCVVLYVDGEYLDAAAVKGLSEFVRSGGGLVALHSAASQKQSDVLAKLIGCSVRKGCFDIEYKMSISDGDHPIAHRLQDFRVTDEIYELEMKNDHRAFLTAWWDGKTQPVGFSREEGNGKVVYLANGHETQVLRDPSFQTVFNRSVRYASGEDWSAGTVKVAAIGYGGAFNMGKLHLQSCEKSRLKAVAVCDVDSARAATAKTEIGEHIQTYQTVEDLLARSDAEMCVIITPHNTHAPLSIQCLNAGRHVVTEKPYTITVDEATHVIETARKAKKMATVFHNRRWDGDFVTIRNLVESGVIGEVFHIECAFGNYQEPRVDWWRSYKETSGGAFYDWGAHFVDWILNLMPHRIESVSGDFKKLKWPQVSNEDYSNAYIRFEGGRSAFVEQGSVNAIDKPRWRILGTKGGIEKRDWDWENKQGLRLVTFQNEQRVESIVPTLKSSWDGFYRNIANHLLLGEPLAVTPESARDVIAVLSLAEQSSQQGGIPLPLPYAR